MPASVTLRTDYSAEELRRLAKSARTVGQGRRLLSLAAVLDGMSCADAARIGGPNSGSSAGDGGAHSPASQNRKITRWRRPLHQNCQRAAYYGLGHLVGAAQSVKRDFGRTIEPHRRNARTGAD